MPTYPQYKRVPQIFLLDEVLRTGKIKKIENARLEKELAQVSNLVPTVVG